MTSAPTGRGKSAHRKCSDTEVQFACTVPQAAPAVNWGLSPLTKPHPGLHHQSEQKKRKRRGSRGHRGKELVDAEGDLERKRAVKGDAAQLKPTTH